MADGKHITEHGVWMDMGILYVAGDKHMGLEPYLDDNGPWRLHVWLAASSYLYSPWKCNLVNSASSSPNPTVPSEVYEFGGNRTELPVLRAR